MCLGIPAKIVEIYDEGGLKMAKVDFGGVYRETCLAYVPEAEVGDYVMVHVGFAINVIDEQAARESLETLLEAGLIDEKTADHLMPD